MLGHAAVWGRFLIYYIYFLYICCSVCTLLSMAYVERTEDDLLKLVLSFCHMNPGDRTQVLRFSAKHLQLLSHVAGRAWVYF